MRILFLPKYHEEGASSRYRTYNYIKYFKEAEHKVDIKPLLYNGYVKDLYSKKRVSRLKVIKNLLGRFYYLLLYRRKYDILIIEKELFKNVPFFLERFLLKGCKYSLDFDDIVSTSYKTNILKEIFFGNKINKLSSGALLTTVGNRWYWNEITRGNLEYLPTVIDIEDYNLNKFNKYQNSVPVIVWIGTPSTVHYLKIIESALQKLSKTKNFLLRIIGADIKIDKINVECLPWSKEKEFEFLFSSDIGIMPLNSTLWEKGKCGFKLIQYMASCLPTVASAAPANEEIIIVGETGFIARDEDEWVNYLSYLIEDKQKRINMGIAARKRIEKNYTYQVWGKKYVEIIEEAVKRKIV